MWRRGRLSEVILALCPVAHLTLRAGCPLAGLAFKLHDFGFRGVSSVESAATGGAGHLVNFMGTDTMAGYVCARQYYDEPMAGFSIPAAEHSTITSWVSKHGRRAPPASRGLLHPARTTDFRGCSGLQTVV